MTDVAREPGDSDRPQPDRVGRGRASGGIASDDGRTPREYIFFDESGDPGVAGDPTYIVLVLHLAESALDRLRGHLTAFRYHNDVLKELKAQRWADKLSRPAAHLLEFLADLTDEGDITTTANWLDKATYRAGGGPHLTDPGTTMQFRNFQLRLLLERHAGRSTWSSETDLVLDRWRMTLDQRANLERYLAGNYVLRPRFAYVTLVDSVYCDPIQVVDIYGRLARRAVTGHATTEEMMLAARLMDLHEVRGGLRTEQ